VKRILVFALGFLILAGMARAEIAALALTLVQAEQQALAFSPLLKAKQAELEATQAKSDVQSSLLWPVDSR
jgi:hypothetical protein